jgi:hypothetical protein
MELVFAVRNHHQISYRKITTYDSFDGTPDRRCWEPARDITQLALHPPDIAASARARLALYGDPALVTTGYDEVFTVCQYRRRTAKFHYPVRFDIYETGQGILDLRIAPPALVPD